MSFKMRNHIKTTYTLNNTIIQEQKTASFLGVILDDKLTLKDHIQNIKRKCYPRTELLKKMCANTKINKSIKKRTYLSLIRSILEYAPVNKLEKIQNNCLKQILNKPTNHSIINCYQQLNITSIKSRIINLTKKWHNKACNDNKNAITRAVYGTSPRIAGALAYFVFINRV